MDVKYSKLTVEGGIKTRWICGCFETVDGYFKFCERHDTHLSRAVKSQLDELDMSIAVDD